MSGKRSFQRRERARQEAYLAKHFPEQIGFDGDALQLVDPSLNLIDTIREKYLGERDVSWHRYLRHGCSSQACCLNFLMPLADKPDTLASLIHRATGTSPTEILPALPSSMDLVAFEYVGRSDYLNEWASGKPTRGANMTSADAIIRYRAGGIEEALLIEWKYIESDNGPIPNKPPKVAQPGRAYGNATRRLRYETLFSGDGNPIRPDLGLELEDFFFHPFYQLLRQQLLALAMERDPSESAEKVRVLHISPGQNSAVRRISGPKLVKLAAANDFPSAYDVFRFLLHDGMKDRFISTATEALFAPIIDTRPDDGWAVYLASRYAFLKDSAVTTEETI